MKRLGAVWEAVAASLDGKALSLTDVGRRLPGAAALRHKIKRADRLLGNRRLHGETGTFYAAMCRVLLARILAPVILIDWTDLKADQSLHLLRASLPVGGRSLTLYEEVHPQRLLGNRAVQHRFLHRLAQRVPAGCAPIVVADSGFKVPFFREVERLGWRWVGRIRGVDQVCLKDRWSDCKSLFGKATERARCLGTGLWVKSNPLRALFVLARRVPSGRHARTAGGERSRSKKSLAAARSAREPWLLVASVRFSGWKPRKLIGLYRQRMQIEESFRDMKSARFGAGLERSRSRSAERFAVLVLIASLAAFLLWLLGTAAQRLGLDLHLRPGSRKRRAYSKLFLARLLFELDSCAHLLDEVVAAVAAADEWAAIHHEALFAA